MSKALLPSQTRGYLNNNPGNVDRSPGFLWTSEIRDVNDPRLTDFQRKELTKGRFAVFPAPQWGIRIIPKNLQSYQKKLGLKSVRAMISRWAPPNENDTEMYIRRVCDKLGVSDTATVDMWNYDVAKEMTLAIIGVELGGNPYPMHVIEDGLRLAGLIKEPKITNSRTKQGAALATSGIAVGNAPDVIQSAIGTATNAIEPLAGTSSTLATIFVVLKVVGVLATIAGLGWMLYSYMDRKKRDQVIEATANDVDDEEVVTNEPSDAMVVKE